MNLSRRLEGLHGDEPSGGGAAAPAEAPNTESAESPTLSRFQEVRAAEAAQAVMQRAGGVQSTSLASEALGSLKERASAALYERMGSRLTDSSLDEAELHQYVRDELKLVVDAEQVPLTAAERHRLTSEIIDDVLGHGPIQRFLDDPEITEVMINRFDSIYVERYGRLFKTEAKFTSDEALRKVIERIVSRVGRRIDESSPWWMPASPTVPV